MQKLLKVYNKHGTKFGDKLPTFVKAYKNVKAHHVITNQNGNMQRTKIMIYLENMQFCINYLVGVSIVALMRK